MADRAFSDLVARAIARSAAADLLARSGRAIVLERIARGGGSTNWFALSDQRDLEMLVTRLSPGSRVSFYFDDRLSTRDFDRALAEEILSIAAEDGDTVVGQVGADGLVIDIEFIAGPSELTDYESQLADDRQVIVGRFPAADDDGEWAITMTLPDPDGVVRPHPH